MKIRSLKHVLHWLFLIVGFVSIMALVFSTATYLDYVREGYGLEVSVGDAWLSGRTLSIRVDVDNPGGLDMYLNGTILFLGSQASDEAVRVTLSPVRVKAGNESYFHVFAELDQDFLEDIYLNRQADITMDLSIDVPERHTGTTLYAEFKGVEVRAWR